LPLAPKQRLGNIKLLGRAGRPFLDKRDAVQEVGNGLKNSYIDMMTDEGYILTSENKGSAKG
jgi:hypothetical protein